MADEGDQKSTPEQPHPQPATAGDRSELIAQAIRFLTSARVTGDATDETKREFLRSKGLSKDEIDAVFQQAKSPANPTTTQPEPDAALSDQDAYERAARQFDHPLAPPPPTYPKSPLALYYDPPPASSSVAASRPRPAKPETRYQVLLRFFRTLSYLLMLGGGATALAVALYRTYILPRITATFDARSIVLKHHRTLYNKLHATVAGLATYIPDETKQQRKGVLKKVHFGDELNSQPESPAANTEKAVMPGTDVVVSVPVEKENKTKHGQEGDEQPHPVTADDESGKESPEQPAPAPKLDPIDLTEPLRQSLSRLAAALKTADAPAPTATGPAAASVTEADSDGEEWEEDDEDQDDGLEFDPYGSYQKQKKHTQLSAVAPGGAGTSLRTSLSSLRAEINTHRFADSFSSSSSTHLRLGGLPSQSQSPASSPSGDIGQVRAEIRSLKGLLLSR